jgi:hypothetical protein
MNTNKPDLRVRAARWLRIRSMDVGELRELIEDKTEERNDLWSAALALEKEVDTFREQGNDANHELAIATVELRKRVESGS